MDEFLGSVDTDDELPTDAEDLDWVVVDRPKLTRWDVNPVRIFRYLAHLDRWMMIAPTSRCPHCGRAY